MFLKKLILPIFFCCWSNVFFAQKDTLAGAWEGKMTVEQNGEILAEYEVFMQLEVTDEGVFGKSYIWYDTLRAVMQLEGLQNGDVFSFVEKNILRASPLKNGEWCKKEVTLRRRYQDGKIIWEGEWQGNTTFSTCTPGKIWFRRAVDRV